MAFYAANQDGRQIVLVQDIHQFILHEFNGPMRTDNDDELNVRLGSKYVETGKSNKDSLTRLQGKIISLFRDDEYGGQETSSL